MVNPNRGLFSWSDVERRPELERLERVLKALPDEELLRALEQRRGRGRDDYPIRAMWRALVAGMVFQHVSVESLLRELRRNPALLDVCGFDPLGPRRRPKREVVVGAEGPKGVLKEVPRGDGVPSAWNFSRFLSSLAKLEAERGLIAGMMGKLREQLMEEVEGFGEHLGYDGKAVESHSTGRKRGKRGQTSDPDADWGKHETGGKDRKTGKLWRKIKTWFGYRVHLIADTRYEIPVACRVTRASQSEVKQLETMTEELFEETPELAKRCRDFSADRGLDSGPVKAKLWDDYGIRPLIEPRELWKEEKQEPGYNPTQGIARSLYPDRADTIVHTEKGEVGCVCPESGRQRPMAFQGFEAERGTLKYRCPAAAYGYGCAGRESCYRAAGSQAGAFGRIVRIPLATQDRRIFTPTPYGSPSWKRGYRRRPALERIYSRLDNDFGFERHFLRGRSRMTARVGLAMTVMMALALAHARAGRRDRMRSLVGAVPFADTG